MCIRRTYYMMYYLTLDGASPAMCNAVLALEAERGGRARRPRRVRRASRRDHYSSSGGGQEAHREAQDVLLRLTSHHFNSEKHKPGQRTPAAL